MTKRTSVKYFTKVNQLNQLSEQEKNELKKITDKFAFRANDYYLSLIDWNDPDDPIRRIVIPSLQELDEWGRLDPSNEKTYTVMPGLQHKYHSVVVFLVTNKCDSLCRYCFRKRLFIESETEYLQDWDAAYQYVREHPEITNALLTGGDALMLPTPKLEEIIATLREIKHVKIIRLGTRIPAYNPYRIIDDPTLLKVIEKYSIKRKKIYIMTHFVHPRELTDVAVEGVNLLQKANAKLANQTPLTRGLNDDPKVLAELLARLSFIGVIPYYIFQCRPALGNKAYTVPIEQGYEIVRQAKSQVSGLAKRARYTMSHTSGKIEIVGKTKDKVYFRYHRAFRDKDSGRFMVFKSNPNACWFDDYDELLQDDPINTPHLMHSPD
ncbi:MAG: KamA family radical SAM protein [Planctomycetota bacterium]|nr:MAG: KamA family radical SAM protein [Planctomycetota bacterium]